MRCYDTLLGLLGIRVRLRCNLLLAAGLLSLVTNVVAADYLTEMKPLLRERCYACHGALKQKGGLRVDTVEAMRQSKVIVPGDPMASIMIERVSTGELDDRMPPEHEGEPLTPEEVDWLTSWIIADAPAPEDEQPEADPEKHWAFQPIARPPVPPHPNAWVRNPIDAFIAQGHEAKELQPQGEASRLILLRRLSFDLLGLPPTAKAIERCQTDPSPDWYDALVARLLDDPQHGERWARHWMDIWRYSDWWGLNQQLRNSQKHIWHWRDWIVESLNEDAPYDEMVRQMLAADELYPTELSKLRATGFLARNYFIFNRTQWMDETVEHVSKAFLGLTMNCAKCHDHKYDPIEHSDYYRLRAFFEPYHVRTDRIPGEPDLAKDGIPRAFDALLDQPTYRYIRGEEKQPDKSTVMDPGVPELLSFKELEVVPVSLPAEAFHPERRAWVMETLLSTAEELLQAAGSKWDVAVAEANLESIQARVAATRASWTGNGHEAREPAIHAERQLGLVKAQRELALGENSKDENHLKKAKQSLKKAEEKCSAPITAEDTFTPIHGARWSATRFLDSSKDDPPLPFPSQSSGRRSALADWITDRRHPLTARVAVNHLWARHFGKPLVADVFDFGRNGSPPTHPELLDWLAVELMDHGWSMKHVHRLMVSSATYRMRSSTVGAATQLVRDPDNRHWWRREPLRLESQAVRDTVLTLSGTLDVSMGGPPVPTNQQASSSRRSLYFFHSNNERNLFLTIFDEARVTDCYRREQSVVPQQALALTNSKL
ncbi:MAG: DUF1549 domain-containing protein, partial [Verrucomicrobiaceae bacterium]|nr:DUF1549 domain-containing protein [Verrucomicrobiaceae bacterium]